jgi:hypothetical protein
MYCSSVGDDVPKIRVRLQILKESVDILLSAEPYSNLLLRTSVEFHERKFGSACRFFSRRFSCQQRSLTQWLCLPSQSAMNEVFKIFLNHIFSERKLPPKLLADRGGTLPLAEMKEDEDQQDQHQNQHWGPQACFASESRLCYRNL